MTNSTLHSYLKVLDTMPHPVMVNDTDEDFKYVFWNKQCCLWTGVAQQDVLDKSLISLLGEEAKSNIIAINKKIIETGEPYFAEEPFYMPNGEMRYTSVEKALVNIGGHNYIVSSRWDITEEYLAKQQADLILNNSSAGFVYLTPDYIVKWENVSSVFKGIPMSSIYKVGTCCYKDYFKRDSPCENCVMARAVAGNKPEIENFSYQDITFTNILAKPVYNPNNKLVGVVLRVTDITDQTRYCNELKTANSEIKRYSTLTDMAIHDSDMFTWGYDIEKDRFFDNYETMIRYGLNPDIPVSSQEFLEMIHPDQREEYIRKFSEIMETGEKRSIDCKVLTAGKNQNGYEWFRYIAELFTDENGKKSIIGTAQCIDSFVRERDLLDNLISVAEDNSRKSFAFLANMSHEIRTPLNSIVGFSQLLEDIDDREERRNYVNIIKNNSDLLMNLVNDILDMSKIEAGKMVDKPASFDLALFFDEVVASLRHRLTNPDIELIIENPYKKCIVELDKNRVAQVITNYVTNAFKYTEKGSVTIGYTTCSRGIKLYVKDTGIGIPKERQGEVFSRFAKLDTHAKGNGLGLSIVKGLTESIGGKVGFESKEGAGSTFWAWKPTKYEIIPK